ncbi:hypothetical protein ACE2AJ_16565 [Aquihabitans daechungensis]|uniref:hypothetical protein n=1 Tax=Aquihabitans daechungensis TaxID=1052257 RepID=UPI003BA2707C
MTRQRALLAAPLVIALLIGGWLLWARQDPARQGGYCSNATLEVAGTVGRSVDLSSGSAIPAQQILDLVDEVDVSRFEVDTPPEMVEQVRLVREERSKEAFARLIGDYLERCGSPG